MQKNILGAGVPQHIDARIPGDVFCAVAPERNLFLQINYADTDLQLVEDVAVDLGIFEGGMIARKRCRLICSSAKKLKKHKALAMSFNFSAEFCQPPTSSPEIARACHFQNCWQSLTSQLSSSGEGCPDDALVSREIRAFVILK